MFIIDHLIQSAILESLGIAPSDYMLEVISESLAEQLFKSEYDRDYKTLTKNCTPLMLAELEFWISNYKDSNYILAYGWGLREMIVNACDDIITLKTENLQYDRDYMTPSSMRNAHRLIGYAKKLLAELNESVGSIYG